MSKQHQIHTVLDMLALSDDEFMRMVPDLITWRAVCKAAEADGARVTGFIWVDDGLPGEIHHAALTVEDTGEQVLVKGSAWRAE